MTESLLAYIPTDRRHALAHGVDLARSTTGAALFADISGFTPLTEALVDALGPKRGAEALPVQLNMIYDALVAQVDRFRGSVLAFSGDAITCWFDHAGDGGWKAGAADSVPSAERRATACALAIQHTMRQFATLEIPGAGVVSLAVKVAVASGPVVRFLVGDPDIQTIDVLAGDTLQRLAQGEHQAERGDVVLDEAAALAVGEPENITEWRVDPETGQRFAVVHHLTADVPPDPWPPLPAEALSDDATRAWMLPPVAARLRSGMGEFLTELRPALTLFLRFGGIDYDTDSDAEAHLDGFIRAVQAVLLRYESYVLQVTIGDKGSYLYTSFGAPVAHGDDVVRAVTAALELRDLEVPAVDAIQIGIGQGRARTGAYGGATRRTYGVLGDEVNLAARLMQSASDNEVLAEQAIRRSTADLFEWEDVAPLVVKGKAQPVLASRLIGAKERQAIRLRQPEYALPMVGRGAEFAVIDSRLDSALSGRGQIVGIVGEAGMGKSRLVAEVVRSAAERGVVGHGGECQSYGVNASYLVWQNIWRSFFGIDSTMQPAMQVRELERRLTLIDPALTERLPVLGPAVNLSIADNDLTAAFDVKLRKASLESLLVDCIRFQSREHALLLVLEDCHWLDPLSHDLLEVLGRATADLPVMIVTAYRTMQAPHLAAPRVSQLANFTEVVLTDLGPAEITELVRTKLHQLYDADTEPGADLIDELSSRAQGNPFYIEELLNFLRSRGVDPAQPDALLRLDLPDSLYSLILGRIDQLTEDQKTVLKVASVIGRLFQAAMLWGVYQPLAGSERLLGDLTTLAEMELTVLDSPEPELAYLFKHVLTQEVAYETLSFATRAMLHDQIAQYIETRHPDLLEQHLDLLAHHYDHSENLPKRREFLLRAGEAAQAACANISAISYFERVLPLVEGEGRITILLRLGQVQEVVGDWPAAELSDQSALAAALQADDAFQRARAELALGVLGRKRGAFADAMAFMTSARRSFERVGDAAGICHVLADIGEVRRLQGHYAEARAFYDESLELASQVADPPVRQAARAHALKGAGTVATWQGDYEAARELNEESLTIGRALSDKPGVAVLLNNQGIIARFQHDLDAARRLNDESLALFREVGDRWAVGQLLNNQACVASDQGEYSEARVLLNESLSIRRQLGDRVGLALSLNTLADVMIDEGDHGSAVSLLDESLAINRELGNLTAIAYLIEDYAGVAAAEQQPERALRFAGFAAGLREVLGAPLPPSELERVDRMVASARAALDDALVDRRWEAGRQLGLAQALNDLLAGD